MSTSEKQRDWDPTLTRPSVVTFVATVALVAVALMVVGALWVGQPDDWFAVVVLAALSAAGALVRETYVGARIRISFISIIIVAAAVIVGPVGAGVVGASAQAIKRDGSPLVVRSFNVSMVSILGSVGGLVYVLVGGRDLQSAGMSSGDVVLGVGLPMMVVDVAQCLVNALLISCVLRVSGGPPIRPQIVKLLSTSGTAYIGYGVIGFLLVVLWVPARVGWFAGVLVLAPLLVARWAFDQYGEELKAHENTLRALVTAQEKKELHNTGHSERVAQLSEWLAQAMGLGHKEVQDVRTAGMLHDVGKVAVPSRLLRGRQPLSDEDLVEVGGHARAGVAVVEGIEFLAGSLDGIAHHHERYDGLGYPAGLSGEDIPLSARIVAVADVFDALTTPRAYRDALSTADAAAIVTERAGRQFDPAVCAALGKVLARHEWTAREPVAEHLAIAGVAIDHDEPEVSDRLAARPDLRARVDGASGAPGQPAEVARR